MIIYGIDERALAAIQKFAPETQSECLQKLEESQNVRKVWNATAFLMGIVTGPDVLSIDDWARQLWNEMPKPMQADLLDSEGPLQMCRIHLLGPFPPRSRPRRRWASDA